MKAFALGELVLVSSGMSYSTQHHKGAIVGETKLYYKAKHSVRGVADGVLRDIVGIYRKDNGNAKGRDRFSSSAIREWDQTYWDSIIDKQLRSARISFLSGFAWNSLTDEQLKGIKEKVQAAISKADGK